MVRFTSVRSSVPGGRRARTIVATAAAALIGLTGLVGLAAAPAAMGAPAATHAAVASGATGDYLALGDSVAFGYRPPQVTTLAQYENAANFSSYADDLAADEGLALTNASCPGETTASFINTSAQSNGCENVVGTPSATNVSYRSFAPLHVDYTGSQLAYAVSFLQTHPETKLVTMTLGANDAFVCEETTADQCSSPAELEHTLATIATNLATIYKALRTQGGYTGPIVALGYYSTSPYTDTTAVELSEALNAAIAQPTLAAGGVMADGLGAFGKASAPFGTDPCAAGLLVPLPDGTCNVHPTARGHAVLAGAFTAALAAAGRTAGTPGYLLSASDGSVFPYGDAPTQGSLGDTRLSSPVVGGAETSDGRGYWLVTATGVVTAFGDATAYGSVSAALAAPIVGMAAAPGGQGYWLVAADGGVFSFGNAAYHGSTGGLHLNAPVVGIAATPDGNGYWLAAADGGIFSFGDATFHGSTGSLHLNKPVVGIAATPDGNGYWLAAADGGIFSFGDATFHGSTGSLQLNKPVVGIAATPDGSGYWLAASDGGIFTFGDAAFDGSSGGAELVNPVVGISVPG